MCKGSGDRRDEVDDLWFLPATYIDPSSCFLTQCSFSQDICIPIVVSISVPCVDNLLCLGSKKCIVFQ